jgi:hypothetical protein
VKDAVKEQQRALAEARAEAEVQLRAKSEEVTKIAEMQMQQLMEEMVKVQGEE